MFQLPSLIRLYSSTGGCPAIYGERAPPPQDDPSEFLLETISNILAEHDHGTKNLCAKFREWGDNNGQGDEFWRLAMHRCFGIVTEFMQPPADTYESWRAAFHDVCLDVDALNKEEMHLVDNAHRLSPAHLSRISQRFRDAARHGSSPGLVWLFASLGGTSMDGVSWMRLDEDLHMAVENDDVSLLRDLLQRGADPNARDGSGSITPLMRAIGLGYVDIVEALLQHPMTYIEATNRDGQTAEQLARRQELRKMIHLIEDAQAQRKAASVRRANFRSEAPREQ